MFDDINSAKLIDGRTASRFFLAGAIATCVFIIAFFSGNEEIALVLGIFLALSILMIFDAILPYHKRFNGLAGLISLILGVFTSIVFSPFPFIYLYFILLLIATAFLYARKIKQLFQKNDLDKEDD